MSGSILGTSYPCPPQENLPDGTDVLVDTTDRKGKQSWTVMRKIDGRWFINDGTEDFQLHAPKVFVPRDKRYWVLSQG